MKVDRSLLRAVRDTLSPDIEQEELERLLRATRLLNPGLSFYEERVKKFREVAAFTVHLKKCAERTSRRRRLILMDCGCGRSYLSFFANYVLHRKLGRDVHFLGVDDNPELVERCIHVREETGFENMEFHASRIIDFKPSRGVDVTYALHACDTATDEAIAKGVELGSRYILVAPCCQRQVMRQLGRVSQSSRPLGDLVEVAVFKERLGVIVTEALRAFTLEAAGYGVDVFEFVSPQCTPKNIMLRAEKRGARNSKALYKYRGLRDFFHVRPKIEEYLPRLTEDRNCSRAT